VKIPTFKSGIHPNDYKIQTQSLPIEVLPTPKEVFIPLQQHIGAPCKPVVEVKEEVKIGQVIGSTDAYVSSPVHATISGIVKDIGRYPNPTGGRTQMVHIIASDEEDPNGVYTEIDWTKLSIDELKNRITNAGIVGLGGAAFPTHVKLSPPEDKPIDTFILNGCECEPFLTADHRTMLEMPDNVLKGMAIIMKVLGVKKGYIGIESNKPDAVESMQKAANGYGFEVVTVKTKYPQGAEKMLIKAVKKRKVPTGGLPMDIGAVVQNVGTAVAVANAVSFEKPLTQRIVTVTGNGIKEPKNLLVTIGTKFSDVIEFCGGLINETAQVFMGGPMMGIAQYDLSVPVIKATSGIVCTTNYKQVEPLACIGCGSCVQSCPMFLMPTRLARLSLIRHWSDADKMGIMNCIECGSCAYVCPSNIPLVQWIRVGKQKVYEIQCDLVV
jgi:Na+-translocating ferredoxin:NAD+ oxidoreductase subunit C